MSGMHHLADKIFELKAENAKLHAEVDFMSNEIVAHCKTIDRQRAALEEAKYWTLLGSKSALDRLEVLYREQSAENAKLQAENTELRQFVSRMAYEGAAIQDLAHKQLAALTNEQKP